MESGKWRSAVDTENLPVNTENLPVNLPAKLAQVLNLIKENPHISYQQIADQIGKSRETVRVYLKQLREEFNPIFEVLFDFSMVEVMHPGSELCSLRFFTLK